MQYAQMFAVSIVLLQQSGSVSAVTLYSNVVRCHGATRAPQHLGAHCLSQKQDCAVLTSTGYVLIEYPL